MTKDCHDFQWLKLGTCTTPKIGEDASIHGIDGKMNEIFILIFFAPSPLETQLCIKKNLQ